MAFVLTLGEILTEGLKHQLQMESYEIGSYPKKTLRALSVLSDIIGISVGVYCIYYEVYKNTSSFAQQLEFEEKFNDRKKEVNDNREVADKKEVD